MPVSKRLRYEILKRDNHACRYCGQMAPEVKLAVDHVTPVALGGSDLPENLVAACVDCNAGKSSTTPSADLVEDVTQEDLRWADAFRRVAAARSEAEKPRMEYVAQFDAKWSTWTYGAYHTPISRDGAWKNTIERFFDIGVPVDELERLTDRACGNDRVAHDETWRYFCGCVWRYVDDVRQAAAELLEQEAADGA